MMMENFLKEIECQGKVVDVGRVINDHQYRAKVMNKLTVDQKIKLSGLIESYSRILKERARLVVYLYGNKDRQLQDENLKCTQSNIGKEITKIVTTIL